MVKSMTGFGRAELNTESGKLIVEVRSLNGKSLDLSLRTPSLYRSVETQIRQIATSRLVRGKSDLMVSFQGAESDAVATVNTKLFKHYFQQLCSVSREVGFELDAEPMLATIMRMPDIMTTERKEVSQEDIDAVLKAVEEACDRLVEFRVEEGKVLIKDILQRTQNIAALLAEVEKYEMERIETVKTRLSENLAKAQVAVDQNRFESEVIYFLEKFDVTEEKVRLAQHIKYFGEVAASAEDSGRKLGFIAQEMGREINTLGSKANHSEMQKLVVGMKDELEKIKEQLLNIL